MSSGVIEEQSSQAVWYPQASSPDRLENPESPIFDQAWTSLRGLRSPMKHIENNFLGPKLVAPARQPVIQRARVTQTIMSRNLTPEAPFSPAIFFNEQQTTEQERTSEQPHEKRAKRHREITHGKEVKYFCDEPGCPRQFEGFKRRDHLRQHVSGKHKRQLGSLRKQTSTTLRIQSPIQATSFSADSQSQFPRSSPSAVALGKQKREDAIDENETPNLEIKRQLGVERKKVQTLVHEMRMMREQSQKEYEERDNRERQLREELERYRDKYLHVLGGGSI